MSELPTIKEEVERKTLDTLEWITSSIASKAISTREAHLCTQTVFQVVSGLLDAETVKIVSLLSEQTAPLTIRPEYAAYWKAQIKLALSTIKDPTQDKIIDWLNSREVATPRGNIGWTRTLFHNVRSEVSAA